MMAIQHHHQSIKDSRANDCDAHSDAHGQDDRTKEPRQRYYPSTAGGFVRLYIVLVGLVLLSILPTTIAADDSSAEAETYYCSDDDDKTTSNNSNNNNNNNDGSCIIPTATTTSSSRDSSPSSSTFVCGLWYAKSNVKDDDGYSGLGIYAGKNVDVGQRFIRGGDPVIPLTDMAFHNRYNHDWNHSHYYYILEEYTWNAKSLYMNRLADQSGVQAFSPGFGSVANSIMDLNNVEEGVPTNSMAGLSRRPRNMVVVGDTTAVNVLDDDDDDDNDILLSSSDPGIGAFTAFYNRRAVANQPVQAGDELFANYGIKWFQNRQVPGNESAALTLGYIPIAGDYSRANQLVQKAQRRMKRIQLLDEIEETTQTKQSEFAFHLWNTFVYDNPYRNRSTFLTAFPRRPSSFNDWTERIWNRLFVQGATTTTASKTTTTTTTTTTGSNSGNKKQKKTTRRTNAVLQYHIEEHRAESIEWLEQHGTCADRIYPNRSTLFPQAGRGAFAMHDMSEGTIVAPWPLLHIPNRSHFNQCDDIRGEENQPCTTHKGRKQLLLNYCMGHRHSSLLLCPYGTHINYINHGMRKSTTTTNDDDGTTTMMMMMPNVKLQWANPHTSNHQPSWLHKTVDELRSQPVAGLAMELIATRDIRKDEEILLDYGTEWEDAWHTHVLQWHERSRRRRRRLSPTLGIDEGSSSNCNHDSDDDDDVPVDDPTYRAAFELNRDIFSVLSAIAVNSDAPTAAAAENKNGKLPWNVDLLIASQVSNDMWDLSLRMGSYRQWIRQNRHEFDYIYNATKVHNYFVAAATPSTTKKKSKKQNDVVHMFNISVGLETATTTTATEDTPSTVEVHRQVPLEFFRFFDKPYTTDMDLPHVFRHDMRIPDELFPDAWKNRLP